MKQNIPTYHLNILSKQESNTLDVFFLNQKMEKPQVSIDIPYRTNYYGVSICLQGKAELKANLKSYTIVPNYITVLSPHVIKQWQYMSDDFETLTIFFTKDFITTNNNLSLDKFQFFESVANHSFQISAAQSENILSSLIFLQSKYGYDAPNTYKNEILKSGINILLYEIASIYDRQTTALNATQNRSQLLASAFKKLVIAHFSKEHSVKFYAEKLFITPKHLTELLNEVTGKTASEWINETIILEAKVLLQNPALTIAQIADLLHFADQSTFSKFFKNLTGFSPVAYRQHL